MFKILWNWLFRPKKAIEPIEQRQLFARIRVAFKLMPPYPRDLDEEARVSYTHWWKVRHDPEYKRKIWHMHLIGSRRVAGHYLYAVGFYTLKGHCGEISRKFYRKRFK